MKNSPIGSIINYILLLIIIISGIVVAQPFKLPPPKMEILPPQAKVGDNVKLIITIPLRKGLHIYSPNTRPPYIPTKVEIIEPGPITFEKPIYPPFYKKELIGEILELIEPDNSNRVVITIPGRVRKNAKAGVYIIKVKFSYQACTTETCLPPVIDSLLTTKLKLILDSSKDKSSQPIAIEKVTETTRQRTKNGTFQTKKEGIINISFLGYKIILERNMILIPLILAFISGLVMNLMPCVLPIIPLKIMQILDQSKRENRSSIILGLLFGIGIITFFLVVGIFAIVLRTGFSWGAQFQNPYFLIAMILLLLFLALGMFGLYEISLPGFIANREIARKGYLSSFLMGFFGGILSTPCSFGLLGAAIAWAQLQSAFVTLVAFFTIGLGMAIPYIVLSMFPKLIEKLPKPGRWMELLKQGLGFVLLIVAVFLMNALPNSMLISAIFYFVILSFVVWFIGQVLGYSDKISVKIIKVLLVVLLILLGIHLLRVPATTDYKIENALTQDTLRSAMDSGRPLLIDFYADWCLSCKVVQNMVYRNPEVMKLINSGKVVFLKADLTRKNPYAERKLREWTSQSGIPATVIIFPDGNREVILGKFSADRLLKLLNH